MGTTVGTSKPHAPRSNEAAKLPWQAKTKVEETMNPSYRGWSKRRRMEEAAGRVVYKNWTVSEAAREFGVSRQRLAPYVTELRAKVDTMQEVSREKAFVAGGETIRVEKETIRVPSFEEFNRLYFGNWICPDCNVHHEDPDFHLEIIQALESTVPRLLVNVPPYHAKSTLVTVKHTIYDIIRNPNSRTLIISKSGTFANTFVTQIQNLLTNPEMYTTAAKSLIEDFGPFQGPGQSWNQNQIYVAGRITPEKDPTVLAVGVGAQIYGRRADRVKFDDVATVENQANPERVLKMIDWIDKEALTRIGRSGQAVWAGTRVHAGDVYSILKDREGYKVIRYPAIIDEEEELVLWPEHQPYEHILTHRADMSPEAFQLVFQNVDLPGVGASFPPEIIEAAKDKNRSFGQLESSWRLIAGLDPASGGKDSGYTAMAVLAVNVMTGHRYIVDLQNVRAMKAPQIKETMLHWSDIYPITEWRVESNGLQAQIFQYDDVLVKQLASRGIRVVPHFTTSSGKTGKWDPVFGVESMSPLFSSGLITIPWADGQTQKKMEPLVAQLLQFPMGAASDTVMALWFAELGVRDVMRRQHLPMFDERMRVPKHVARRRVIVDPATRQVNRVPIHEQHAVAQAGQRYMVGRPEHHGFVPVPSVGTPSRPLNVPAGVWGRGDGEAEEG